MPSHECPRCQSRMSPGFLIDNTYGSVGLGTWCEGKPEKSVWTGVKVRGRRQLAIESWRCERCGYLENYAPAG